MWVVVMLVTLVVLFLGTVGGPVTTGSAASQGCGDTREGRVNVKQLGRHCVCEGDHRCVGPACERARFKLDGGSTGESGWKAGACDKCRCHGTGGGGGYPPLSHTAFPHRSTHPGETPRLSMIGNGSMGLRRGVGGNMMRVVKTVYVTRAFDLAPAEVSLVDAMKHEMPPPPFALLDAAGELVDEQFRPVSAEEVYLHHAIVHSSLGTSRSGRRLHQNPNARPGADLFCEPMYTFAHGFDSMNRSGARPTTDFGDAKGLPETAAMVFPTGANGPGKPAVFAGQWHVIRTEGVAGGRGGLKDCTEQCTSADVVANCPNAGLWPDGTKMRCCDEGATIRGLRYLAKARRKAPGPFQEVNPWVADLDRPVPEACHPLPGTPMKTKRYYFKYTAVWTPDIENVEPVSLSVLRAPGCATAFELQPTAAGSPHSSVGRSWTAPFDIEVVAAQTHVHLGAVNTTLTLDGTLLCTLVPTIGRHRGVPGDELGYITGKGTCLGGDGKTLMFVVKKGQVLRMETFYRTAVDDDPDPALPRMPGGGHSGAMAYVEMLWRRWSRDTVPLKHA